MTIGPGDFELTTDDLRAVAAYAAQSARAVLPVYERDRPGDRRPRAAIEAASAFVDGDRRSRRQRVTALDAHRAAAEASTETARLAARAAGDAAAAAYLHPIAQATQVGHILRAAALEARIAELGDPDDPQMGQRAIERARRRATPALVRVLERYPPAPAGRDRVAVLMRDLDASLRAIGP